MTTQAGARGKARSEAEVRRALRERLEARREEIEAAVLTRVKAIADREEAADPAYLEGLRRAAAAALGYGLEAIVHSDRSAPPVPVAMLAQARLAARNGIGLDTVLRRYSAGYSLLGYFVIEEASKDGLMSGAELQRLVGTQAGIFDRLLAVIGEEHRRESEAHHIASRQRQAEQIERLLAGEMVDTTSTSYDFEGLHLGVVATGDEVESTVRRLASGIDCRLILLPRAEGALWAWLGGRRRLDPADLLPTVASHLTGGQAVALGEPAEGLSGWRLTHRQAAAALAVAHGGSEGAVRYADVALLAAALQDDLLATSLRRLYLEPLTRERNGGAALRETLRAYIASGANASSAAASLEVSRQAVAKRLRVVEDRIGRPLGACLSQLDTALRLADIDRSPERQSATPRPLSVSHW